MKIRLQIPPHWKCEFHTATLLAMGSGIGAACGYGLLNWWYAIAVAPFLLLLNRRQLIYAVCGFLLCAVSGVIQKDIADSNTKTIPGSKGKIAGKIICIDRRISGIQQEEKVWLTDCRIESGERTFTAKAAYPQEKMPFYGDKAEFTGRIIPAKSMGLICENNEITGELPPPYGDAPLIIIDSLTPEKAEISVFRYIFKCRKYLLEKLVSGINDPQIAAMAARLFFGASPRIAPEYRKNFIESGTIHLFSVSGLHVMLVAGIVLWLLKLLPFRLRYCLAAVITLLYVLCTGAALPAVRAGCMVIIWCLLRSRLIYVSSWQALMWTWSVFVFIDPESTGTLSAQYSFGITAALLLAGSCCREYFKRQYDIIKMMPFKAPLTVKYAAKIRLQQKFISASVIVLTAFAAGCGLTLYRQNQFTPGSIPANILLLFLSPLLFGTFGIKMLCAGIIPVLNRFAALLLETVFHALLNMTQGVSEFFTARAMMAVPLWSVMLFYICFFGMYGLKNVNLRKLCALTALGVFLCWVMPVHREEINILVINNNSSNPALIAINRPGCSSVIVDTPDRESALAAGRSIREQGIKRAQVIFSSGTLRSARGIKTLNSSIDTDLYAENWKRKPSKALSRMLQENSLKISSIPNNNAKLYNIGKNSLKIISADGIEIISQVTGEGRQIDIHTADGRKFRQTLPWCSLPVIWQCRIK